MRRTAVLLLLAACAPKVLPVPGPLGAIGRDRPPIARLVERGSHRGGDPSGDAIVDAARHYLHTPTRGFRDDCSGFVMAVLDRAGMPISGNTASIYAWADERGAVHHRKRPHPGDLVFFDDTYDRNDNHRNDDPLSHIAVVLEVEENGTILMAHDGTSRGRTTLRMNLESPGLRSAEDGAVLNDWLRARRDSDPKGTRYLAGELWRAFATVRPNTS
jgi:hypothetical protein